MTSAAPCSGVWSQPLIRNSRLHRRLVGRIDAGHPGELAGAGAGVEPFGVPLLADVERRVDPHLEERQAARVVDLARPAAVLGVRGHERDDRDHPRTDTSAERAVSSRR
jgi:hypothetical protein